jgi:hypothetical protein
MFQAIRDAQRQLEESMKVSLRLQPNASGKKNRWVAIYHPQIIDVFKLKGSRQEIELRDWAIDGFQKMTHCLEPIISRFC